MLSITITDAVISKGYNGAPAFYSSDDGRIFSFKVGTKVYDKKAENQTRWLNFNVNAFDDVAGRVRKMNLKEGSHINLAGDFDMKPWVNRTTGEVTTWPTIKLSVIEYATPPSRSEPQQQAQATAAAAETSGQELPRPEQLSNFTGYEHFGSANPYYNEDC